MLHRAVSAVLAGFVIFAAVGSVAANDRSVLVRGVPHIQQKPDFCGEACVAMALRKHGKQADQDFVFDQSGLSPETARGCYTKELARAVRRVGFDAGPVWYSVKPDRADTELDKLWTVIHRDLTAGFTSLVCMHYDDQSRTTEHFRLIIGFDAERDEVIYQEPASARGSQLRMPRKQFLRLWPLKNESEKWTVVLMRLHPTDRLQGETSSRFTDADYAQHIMRLKKKLPGDEFTVVLQKPFVVVGDEPASVVKRRAVQTVKWAVDRLKKDYFTKDPLHIIDVWLFRDKTSYTGHARKLFRRRPNTPFGYYSYADRALIMNISTGGGTLVHEIVHPFMESNFEKCPSWFNEGLASLYEQSRDEGGRIQGSTNWRLRGLQEAIKTDRVPAFLTLCSTTTHEFYQEDPGTNYSQARYLCYYLQEHGLLTDFYHRFRKNVDKDPTGSETLKAVLKTKDLSAFQKKWQAWVLTLRF